MTDDIESAALLLGSAEVQTWFLEGLREVADTHDISYPLIVIDDSDSSHDPSTLSRLASLPCLRYAKERYAGDPNTYRDIDSVDLLADAAIVRTTPRQVSEYRVAVPDDVVDRIATETNIVFHLGYGILTGDILTDPEYGVLSYHHGDLSEYRGGPPGFWEFLRGESSVGVTLQQLTEELDAGRVVAYGETDVTDASTWPEVREAMYAISPGLLTEGVTNIQDDAFEPGTPSSLGTVYSSSDIDVSVLLRFALRSMLP